MASKQGTSQMEPQDSEVKVAVLQNDIKHINDTLQRMELKWDVAIKSFVTTDQLALIIANGEEKHSELHARITSLENWKDWIIRAILLIVIGAVLGTVFVIK